MNNFSSNINIQPLLLTLIFTPFCLFFVDLKIIFSSQNLLIFILVIVVLFSVYIFFCYRLILTDDKLIKSFVIKKINKFYELNKIYSAKYYSSIKGTSELIINYEERKLVFNVDKKFSENLIKRLSK